MLINNVINYAADSSNKGVFKGWRSGAGSWFDAWLTSAAAQVDTLMTLFTYIFIVITDSLHFHQHWVLHLLLLSTCWQQSYSLSVIVSADWTGYASPSKRHGQYRHQSWSASAFHVLPLFHVHHTPSHCAVCGVQSTQGRQLIFLAWLWVQFQLQTCQACQLCKARLCCNCFRLITLLAACGCICRRQV